MKISLTSSAATAKIDEPLELHISVENTSAQSFYVCADVDVATDRSMCNYDLQIRPVGRSQFTTLAKGVNDPPYREFGTRPSDAEFKTRNNLLLLMPNHFVGVRLVGTWHGLTLMSPGMYEIRVVYSSPKALGIELDKPFFRRTTESNVVRVEIRP